MVSRIILSKLFILLLGIPLVLNAQVPNPKEPGFVHLDGKVGKDGVTHLIYQIYKDTPPVVHEGDTHKTYENHVYHLNTSTMQASVYLRDYREYRELGSSIDITDLIDYKLFGKGVEKYVATISGSNYEPWGVIEHYKEEGVFHTFRQWERRSGEITSSATSDSMYVTAFNLFDEDRTLIGDDHGRQWPEPADANTDSSYYNFRVLTALASREGDMERDVLIGTRNDTLVVKQGNKEAADTVNTAKEWSALEQVYVDADSTHLYFKLNKGYDNPNVKVLISDQRAQEGSFTEIGYEITGDMKLAVDDSTSGRLFAIDGKRVLRSTDYGKSFRFWHEMEVAPTGIYFDSYHQDLYISTSKYIFRVDPSKPFHERDIVRETEIISTANKERPVARRPEEFELKPNYPNPFNPSTNIEYRLPEPADVELSVYNAAGKKLFTKVDQYQQAGTYNVRLDMSGYSSGIYFYRLKTGKRQQTRKMLFMK